MKTIKRPSPSAKKSALTRTKVHTYRTTADISGSRVARVASTFDTMTSKSVAFTTAYTSCELGLHVVSIRPLAISLE